MNNDDFQFQNTEDLRTDEFYLQLVKTVNAQPEIEWVPAYIFHLCLPDDTVIGKCDFRVGFNDKIYYGGNIGYRIDRPYRGHHYALKACQLLFKLARRHKMHDVYITCTPDNDASARTIELAGGKYLETARIPEDNEMYLEGKRQVKIYRVDLI